MLNKVKVGNTQSIKTSVHAHFLVPLGFGIKCDKRPSSSFETSSLKIFLPVFRIKLYVMQ